MKLTDLSNKWYIYVIATSEIVGNKSGYATSTGAFGALTRMRSNGKLPRGVNYSVGTKAAVESR